jgi:enoyl-CoA hydratase
VPLPSGPERTKAAERDESVDEKSHLRHERHVRAGQIRHGPAGHGEGQSPDAPRGDTAEAGGAAMADLVLVERDDPIAVVLLNRPKQLNALSDELMDELVSEVQRLDRDDSIRCIVLGGSERAFAAGADIGELARSSAIELYYARRIERWDAIRELWTPLVAAVSGYCLGGGCELAMACDLIVASETARFGQPETSLGIIPGAGGTQRLTRAVGKALAMDVILSGRLLSAEEGLAAGLVARVVAQEAWLDEAKRVARDIASKGPVATRLAKEAVDRAYESTLQLGLEYERRALYLAFASEDAKEGLTAFSEKRKPDFRGR